MRGTMLWFNETKDFGFISTDEGERLRVHGSDFTDGRRPKGRCAGLAVSFRVDADGGTPKAEEVVFVQEAPARRARSRHGGRGVRNTLG